MSARDYGAILRRYARRVVDGKQVAGRLTRLACERQLRDLRDYRRAGSEYVFSRRHVDSICGFFEKLPHVKGDWGSPTIQLQPWQVFALGTLYGWRRRSDGLRRFTDAYWEIARKAAKSVTGAGIALYGLTCEGEQGADVKTAATTGDQARIVFDMARQMAEHPRMAGFRAAFGISVFRHSIYCASTQGLMGPINAKSSTQDGLSPWCSIIDELHAHKDRGLYDVLQSARGARRQPLTFLPTTAGYNQHGICAEVRRLGVAVLERDVDLPWYMPLIYTIDGPGEALGKEDDPDDEGDDPFDESCWIKAQPNLGVSASIDDMRTEAARAQASPGARTEFLTKKLNVWCTGGSPYLNMARWHRCAGDVPLKELETVPCHAGLDLASVSDIAGIALAWEVDDRVFVWAHGWIPESAIVEREAQAAATPFGEFVRAGWLTATPGEVTDYAAVRRDVGELLDRFQIESIAYDPWNATQLAGELASDGAPMVEFRQGFRSYNGPMRELEHRIAARSIVHDGNGALSWCASNLRARYDPNENRAPDRRRSEDKIDMIVAVLEALGRLRAEETDTGTEIPEGYSVVAA